MQRDDRRVPKMIRAITAVDLPALFAVRVATRENALSCTELEAMGVTEDAVTRMLAESHQGWLAEQDGRVVGFAMGNGQTGEMWVIAVLPEFEDQGFGGRLLGRVEEWLWSLGWEELWLTTDLDPTLRAYGFYRHHGWVDARLADGLRYMAKHRPSRTEEGEA